MPTLGTFGTAAARGFGLTTAGRLRATIAISSDTANYVLNTAKVTGYKPGATDVILTINSGVTVSSASTGSYAFTVDTSWSTGDTITIVNNGVIIGRGGNGGPGAYTNFGPDAPGGSAGPALLVQRAVSINNVNRISGGGGGGGGGAYSSFFGFSIGGGGGGGIGVSTGGSGGSVGGDGTLTSAGSGGFPGPVSGGGRGGDGGGYGSSGSAGQITGFSGPAGSGGAGGAAVVGNSNITWIATGTRNGSIS